VSEARVELHVIRTGDLPIPRAYVFRDEGGNALKRVAGVLSPRAERLGSHCLAFVVRHPRAGTFLIDTGFHPDARADRRGDFGWRMALMFSGLRPAAEPFDEQLRAAGVEPAEVERVVMTHLHVDHTSGVRLLPNARFTVTRPEWDAATASSAAGRGYVAHHLPGEDRVDHVDFAADGTPLGPFGATIDWLGDGTVRLISTPGHTHGHMSVLLRTARLGEVLVVGDAAYTVRSIDERLVPLLMGGGEGAYRRSLAELKDFADEHPDAIVVPSHDPTAWRALGAPAVELV
jgi:glyoxylase-like metal-dependent hydrolase (beta-lactamase superfamily II)